MSLPQEDKILKYLNKRGEFNPLQSEAIREAYKEQHIKKMPKIEKITNSIKNASKLIIKIYKHIR